MTSKLSGEISLKVTGGKRRLRLTIAGIQAVEDHFDMSILQLAGERMATQQPRLGDLVILYAVMTDRDLCDNLAIEEAGAEMLSEVGLLVAAKAVSDCMAATLMPDVSAPAGRATKKPKQVKKTTKK